MPGVTIRVGSLFSGIGCFELGVERAVRSEGADVETIFQVEIEPYCRNILAKHWPSAKRFDDVRRVATPSVPLPSVDILCGGFPCFPAGTTIETSDGPRLIESITVGDRVATHERRLRRVVSTMRRRDAPLVEVCAMGALPLRTTAEHPFLARRMLGGRPRRFSDPEWVASRDLTKRHYVAQIVRVESDRAVRAWESTAFWYLVGRWLGDGWIIDHKRTSKAPQGTRGSRVASRQRKAIVCCAHDEADDLAAKINAAGLHATRAPDRTSTKFHITSAALVDFLAPFGRGAAAKIVAPFVFDAPTPLLAELFRGWIEADGSSKDGRTRATTVSRALAEGMARVGRIALGEPVSIHRHEVPGTTVIEGRTVNQRTQYAIGYSSGVRKRREGFHDQGLCWVPVRSVSDVGERADVFNFEVEDDNSYVAGSLVVHNCQDTSVAGNGAGVVDGARSGLWREFHRIIVATRPVAVLVENVPGLRSRGLDIVVGDLAAAGFDVAWDILAAADVGAPHRRRRMWIAAWRDAADADGRELWNLAERRPGGSSDGVRGQGETEPRDDGAPRLAPDASPDRRRSGRQSDREREGARGRLAHRRDCPRANASDADSSSSSAGAGPREGDAGRAEPDHGARYPWGWGDAPPALRRMDDGSSARVDAEDGHALSARRRVITAKLEDDSERIAALGNAIVPQCAEVATRWLLRLMAAHGARSEPDDALEVVPTLSKVAT